MTSKKIVNGRRVQLAITEEDITLATRRDSSHCMIADAIKRQVTGASHVSVDLATIRFTDRAAGVRYVYLTPSRAQAALVKFDQGMNIEPFGVRLTDPMVVNIQRGVARKKANLVKNPNGGGSVPLREDGITPPRGPLTSDARTTGRIRKFGLKNLDW